MAAADVKERSLAIVLGSAITDSLGALVEFQKPDKFEPVTADAFDLWEAGRLNASWGNPWRLASGQFTDDTIMACCMLESFATQGRLNPVDHLARYRRWLYDGYWSPHGYCFDIGGTTRRGVDRTPAAVAAEPFMPMHWDHSGGNGGIMRQSPMPLATFYVPDPALRAWACTVQSRTTHSTPACVQCSFLLNEMCLALMRGEPKSSVLAPGRWCGLWDDPRVRAIEGMWPLTRDVQAILDGLYQHKVHPTDKAAIRTGAVPVYAGYCAEECLDAALWALHHSTDFVSGALLAVNLGEDSDTVGAVYGQLGGALYGLGGDKGVPLAWAARVWRGEEIRSLAVRVLDAGAAGTMDVAWNLPPGLKAAAPIKATGAGKAKSPAASVAVVGGGGAAGGAGASASGPALPINDAAAALGASGTAGALAHLDVPLPLPLPSSSTPSHNVHLPLPVFPGEVTDPSDLAAREAVAQAAYIGDWPSLLSLLEAHPHLVNATRIGSRSGYAPLHQAAYNGADAGTVQRLLDLGGSRTLATTEGGGQTAHEIAVARRGAGDAAALLLSPPPLESFLLPDGKGRLSPSVLAAMQATVDDCVLPVLAAGGHASPLPLAPLLDACMGRAWSTTHTDALPLPLPPGHVYGSLSLGSRAGALTLTACVSMATTLAIVVSLVRPSARTRPSASASASGSAAPSGSPSLERLEWTIAANGEARYKRDAA